MNPELVFSVSDFVAVFNQTIETAYSGVSVLGELANFRVSKNRWVYFDLKDEFASVRFFGTVYNLPGPLEDGMMLQVSGQPRLHPLYGFSINIQLIKPVGEGSLRRAAALLQAKLEAEGLFDDSRKRALPYPPRRIGLITSSESAAYSDFIKILDERWSGLAIDLFDVQVQGEKAPEQITNGLSYFNNRAELSDIIVITRGGGSAEDLAAFNSEMLVRAVASSRVPTLVAIGHEVDISLAEMAADRRASTPSNAAELLVPDKKHETSRLSHAKQQLGHLLSSLTLQHKQNVTTLASQLNQAMESLLGREQVRLSSQQSLLLALNPNEVLKRGYAIIKKNGKTIRSIKLLNPNEEIEARLFDGTISAVVKKIKLQ